ncbi:hypothetical protein DFH06DRAFT_1299297 [Mycena polygramma]|nr:hypothetical protein DFH06DRAFT_1299297 [Mycena polygramma]
MSTSLVDKLQRTILELFLVQLSDRVRQTPASLRRDKRLHNKPPPSPPSFTDSQTETVTVTRTIIASMTAERPLLSLAFLGGEKKLPPSQIMFPEPVNRILLRKRFLSSAALEEPLEIYRGMGDESLVQTWLEDNFVCCNRSNTSFCYCGKDSISPTPRLPPEMLCERFDTVIPGLSPRSLAILRPDLGLVQLDGFQEISSTGIQVMVYDFLYRNIFIRSVPAIQSLLVALRANPSLGAVVRNTTVMCFVPQTYHAAVHPDLTQILKFCPRLTSLNYLPPFPPPIPFSFPALPSTITSLKLSIHSETSAVYHTLRQYCSQLEELSLYPKDDEEFDAVELALPRLHTLLPQCQGPSQAFDPRVRGNWSLEFQGLSVCQKEVDGCITIQFMDIPAARNWGLTYFGMIELPALLREGERALGDEDMEAENSDGDSDASWLSLESEDVILDNEFDD